MIELRMLYVCRTSQNVLGLKSSEIHPGVLFDCIHPGDLGRYSIARGATIRMCNEMYYKGEDYFLISSNFRYKHKNGKYINNLLQAYAFTRESPKHTAYTLNIHTDIDWFGKLKNGYHYYLGKDLNYFRKPDEELILTGCIFTDREYEILKLLRQGLDSHEIGEKLFLSTHTIDTHRRNILKKTNKSSTSDLIIELMEKGFF